MNKTHIALAIAALMPAAAAMADVTIYGEIRGGYEYNKTYSSTFSLDGNNKLQGGSQINDWTSRIGFKGNEDLGNGLKAIWQVENRVHIDGTTGAGSTQDTFATRDSFIGLAGESWGKFRLGRLSNYANDMMEQVDPGYYSDESVGGLGMFTRLDGRQNNAVRYDSPNWNGFSFALLYGTDEKRTLTNGSTTNNQTWNLGLSYENSGFFGKYNYQNWNDADKLTSVKDWHRLEAGYIANNLYAALGYQQIQGYGLGTFYNGSLSSSINTAVVNAGYTQAQINGAKLKTKELALTLGYTFGAFTPYFSYVKGYDASLNGNTIDKSGYDQFVLALDYALSKRTEVYTSYGHVKWKDGALDKENSFGLGLVHRF
ncbi:hypothetical protein VK98_11655 [Chromobacterium sp. LK11]|uniref:porin n=1 Tax=Chromobacterium sp. LK11 TaxID=1628212 RepID=UPI000652F5D7|nr:porin [Chromobacterium sp. LK11]KMN81767.1 hypothetical protein VK98_11655 [Chromobacterium sp. LK11]